MVDLSIVFLYVYQRVGRKYRVCKLPTLMIFHPMVCKFVQALASHLEKACFLSLINLNWRYLSYLMPIYCLGQNSRGYTPRFYGLIWYVQHLHCYNTPFYVITCYNPIYGIFMNFSNRMYDHLLVFSGPL